MPRFLLRIEYAGTRYRGWQIQNNARTVQGEIARAAREVLRTDNFELYGSGRTDAGVHAIEQVAHLATSVKIAPGRLADHPRQSTASLFSRPASSSRMSRSATRRRSTPPSSEIASDRSSRRDVDTDASTDRPVSCNVTAPLEVA